MDMNVVPADLLPDFQALLQQIKGITTGRRKTSESFEKIEEAAAKAVPKSGRQAGSAQLIALSKAVSRLAIHAHDAMLHEPDYFEDLIQLFATTTKSSSNWRSNFGFFMLDSYDGHEKRMQRAEPDCILELARRICTLKYEVSPPEVTSALKIIANCCADNNANRKLIIHRHGIEVLLHLGQHGADLDALIPTLYNVCVDYDEPAVSLRTSLADHEAHKEQANESLPSLSIEHLGSAYQSNSNFVTFELLLSLYPQSPDNARPYLAELIEMATEPALSGFQHIHAESVTGNDPWTWSFTVGTKTYDTIWLATDFARRSPSSLGHLCRAMTNILSQQVAQDALFSRDGNSIWTLMTMACPASGSSELEELEEELHAARRAFLKILYQVSSHSSFCVNMARVSDLIRISTGQLERRVHSKSGQSASSDPTSDSHTVLTASACVVISQLLVSQDIRDKMVEDTEFCMVLSDLLGHENNPDVLYPAVTIVSRMALTSQSDVPFGSASMIRKMQRLLTAKGLGLIVPFETVTAYKTIVRGRPHMIGFLLSQNTNGQTVMKDILQLWISTIEAGTSLEIAKFFLETFRTVLPSMSANGLAVGAKDISLPNEFAHFVSESAAEIAKVFSWVCTNAEPVSQRDHGWFGLAMLSVWPDGAEGIFAELDHSADLRSEVVKISEMKDGAAPNNLKLMLSKMQDSFSHSPVSSDAQNILRTAATNQGLIHDT